MTTYDKPIWQLVKDAIREMPEVFTHDDVVNWFRGNYPKIKQGSIRAHVLGMSVNSPTRRHYRNLLAHGVLYKIDRYRYTSYDPARHGQFDMYGRQAGIADEDERGPIPDDVEGFEAGEPSAEESEFALEQHLEDFMERNWSRIEFGMPLEIWVDPDDVSGRQYPSDVGFIDFLCKDQSTGSFVVVELKKGRTSDAVVGQTQRYMGWVKRNLETEGRPVLGMIIASDLDEKLRYALDVAPQIDLRLYRVNFDLVAPEEPNA